MLAPNLEQFEKLIKLFQCLDSKQCRTKTSLLIMYYLSRIVRKPDFCLGENKGADQLRGNREADQRLCFRYTDSTISLLLIAFFQLSENTPSLPVGKVCKCTVYIRAYAEQTVTERTDVYRSTRFFAPKMFCTVFHPKLYASNVLLYRPCMSIYYLPKHHNFRHGSLVV